jgi:hypothetical protein
MYYQRVLVNRTGSYFDQRASSGATASIGIMVRLMLSSGAIG